MNRVIILFSFIFFNSAVAFCQTLKVDKAVDSVFVEYKAYWDSAKKVNYWLKPDSKVKVGLLKGVFTLNNIKSEENYSYEIFRSDPTNKSELYGTTNFKVSLKFKWEDGDKKNFFGLSVERFAESDSTSDYWSDLRNKMFEFLVNGSGDALVKTRRMAKTSSEKNRLSIPYKMGLPPGFKTDEANLLTIERKWMKWNFFINNKLIYSYNDNSFGTIGRVILVTEPKVKISCTDPSFVIYQAIPYPLISIPDSLSCYNGSSSYFNAKYRFELCLAPHEVVEVESLDRSKTKHSNLRFHVKDTSVLKPGSIKAGRVMDYYPVSSLQETDQAKVFRAFEEEVLRAANYTDRIEPESSKSDTFCLKKIVSRVYSLKKGNEDIHFGFIYLTQGNSKTDLLCLAYSCPGRKDIADAMEIKVHAMIAQTKILQFD